MASYNQSVMDLLFDEASEMVPVCGARITAAIVFKNKIISIGRNKNKTHPFQKRFCKHPDSIILHAENDAIVKALKRISVSDLSKSTIYIARAKKLNKHSPFGYGMVKPCEGCTRALAAFNIKTIYYTTEEGTVECL